MPEFDNAHVEATPEKVRVAVVGGGIAGLTCALRLAQSGCDVTIYEAADRIGGNTSSAGDAGAYQDVYPHIFPDWYANFWQLFEQDLGFRREEHFSPRSGVKVLDKPTGDPSPDEAPKYMDMALAPTWKSVVTNMRSEVLSIPDFFLFAFLNLDLAAQPPDPNNADMLSRLDVNGYFYSRAYSTEATAALQDYTISVIWSLPSDLTSAMVYKKFIKHQLSSFGPYAWMLKGSLQAKLIGPLERKLTGNSEPGEHDCIIKTRKKVHSVEVLEDGVPRITIENPGAGGGNGQVALEEAAPVDYVVLAVPGNELARLVMEGAPGRRLVDKVPALSQLGRLKAEAIPVVNLYFKRKLPFFVPQEIIGLRGAEYDLTVLDISQLWDGSEKFPDVTVLVLAASDVHSIPSKDSHEQGYLMIKRLSEYLSFDPGRAWGESRDIDWQKTAVRQNTDHLLFVNDVGSRRWRPLADYSDPPHGLHSVFFAGDVCQTDVDMATIEAAVQSGATAARALQKVEMGEHGKRRMATVPIRMAPHKVFTDATFLAAKLALLPFAYGAAAWSAARGVANGDDVGTAAYSPGKYVMLLPYQYVADWWKTAYWLARGLNGPIEGVDPADVPIGFGRRDIPPSSEGPDAYGERSEGAGLVSALVDLGASALGALGDVLQEISASHRSREETAAGHQPASLFTGLVVQALQAVQAAYEGKKRRSDDGAADQRPYQRRWRVKE